MQFYGLIPALAVLLCLAVIAAALRPEPLTWARKMWQQPPLDPHLSDDDEQWVHDTLEAADIPGKTLRRPRKT